MSATKMQLDQPTGHTEKPRKCYALLPCAGIGSRAGTAQPKQYEPVAGQSMVEHTLQAFASVERTVCILVVVARGDSFFQCPAPPVAVAHCGGQTRAESVFNGLDWLLAQGADPQDWVLVHDAARCLITPAQINALIDACMPDPVGGLLALPLPDTLKDERDGRVNSTIDRRQKWLAQTPQMFPIGALRLALASHLETGFSGITDESSAMEASGHRPLLVPGSASNFKVTYPEDFALAEAVLAARASA
ncbi:2-C-methyl-D-erythritol 4-phosphate cytidylyltransferase [Ottowia thiooxydans]|uniref:2-C-methyl-D-erythritol 4-phosphate cytidylyltransferase n=1 Tax=Ottowia thiooxydans TaxID=219182 RepID=A0ABV2QC89_9BURK